jgi:hypothetical protein
LKALGFVKGNNLIVISQNANGEIANLQPIPKGKVATYEFTKPIEVLLNASKVFKNSGTKKEVENDLLSCLAPQVGLEPTTYGLTVRRSNQLSY